MLAGIAGADARTVKAWNPMRVLLAFALGVQHELQRVAGNSVVLVSAIFLLCAGYTLLHQAHERALKKQ